MADVDIYLRCNDIVRTLPEVKRSVRRGAKEVGAKAEVLLDIARATTPHSKLGPDVVNNPQPSHLTEITVDPAFDWPGDWFVSMWAPAPSNPVAIEYGHMPSGFFKNKPSKAPEGLYILHRAAGLI
jgi:hypothetical protein